MNIVGCMPCTAVALLALISPVALAQGASAAPKSVRHAGSLPLHRPIDREIGIGQTDIFIVHASKGQFLHIVVEEKGVDLTVVLADHNGRELCSADNPQYRVFGPIPASVIVDAKGEYEVRVQKSPRTADTGPYRITLAERRMPTEEDRTRLQAETEFHSAVIKERAQGREDKLEAIGKYQQAAYLWHSLHDDDQEALCLHRIGANHANLGELQESLPFPDKALLLWRAAGDRAGEAMTLDLVGNIVFQLGQNQKALNYLDAALSLGRESGDRSMEALILQSYARIYLATGKLEQSAVVSEQALTLRRAMGDRRNQTNILVILGRVYRELGQNQKALGNFDEALSLSRASDDRLGEANALYSLGYTYSELDDHQKALDYSTQCVKLYHTLGSIHGEANGLTTRGFTYSWLGEHQKSLTDLTQALSLFRSEKSQTGEALALGGLGFAYSRMGNREEALNYYNQALPLLVATENRSEEGWARDEMGGIYVARGDMQMALRFYLQALQVARRISNTDMQGVVLSDLMKYWKANQNGGLAIFFGKQAVNQFQMIRRGNQGIEQQSQRAYLAFVTDDYRRLADLLIAQGRLSEAEQVLSLLKEQEYFDFVRRDGNAIPQVDGSASLTPEETAAQKRYREISDKLVAIGVKRGELLARKSLTDEETQLLTQLENDISVGNAEFEQFLNDLSKQFAGRPQIAMAVEEIRENQGVMEDLRELPPGTVAILTVVGEDKFRAILRTPDVQKAYEYPITAADLNRKVLEFRKVLKDPTLDPRPLAEDLYKILVGPMADDLHQGNAKTLMWSLDGVLRYLPISALFDGHQYLVENYRVSVMTLASTTRLKDQPDAKRLGVGFGVTKALEGAPALPGVAAEMAAVIATKAGDPGAVPGEVDMDSAFTQQSMRQALLKRYAVVHIASHFRFQPGDDSKSYLLLGNGDHLTLAQLRNSANLFGGVQLLTLSACNTGLGDGAEVEGFGTLAQRQGAKAVVASLWPVADQSTSLLMQNFYRKWQATPALPKLEALRQAQLELLHGSTGPSGELTTYGWPRKSDKEVQPRERAFPFDASAPYAHPYYWAPFFLMGNWL